MTIFQLISREKARLLQEKASIECQIHDAPPGTLTFVKNKSKDKIYYKWYVRNEKSGSRRSKKYLRRQEKKFAKTLAKKGLLKARLDDINRELKALDAYLSKHCDSSFFRKLVSSPGYGELYADDEIPINPDIKEELEVLILGANTPWIYTNVTRQEFEAVKDKVERIFVELGCIKVDIDLPYVQKTTSILGDGEKVVDYSYRPTFHKGHWYYRVDEVCFPDKPFITIEFGDYNDLINNIMEDLDPFPFDLTDSELLDEVKRKIIEE